MIRHRPLLRPLSRLLPGAVLLACLACPQPSHAATDPIVLALGAGMQRMPSWPGASTHRNEPIPYVDFEWPDHVSLSTLDGLQVDFIGGSKLHGGAYGDYQWGRDRDDLGALGGKVPSLSPRLTLGGYLEWDFTKHIDLGTSLSHDIAGAGGYWRLYADLDLPTLGLLHHSLELSWQAMNRSAMQRFFGIDPGRASALAVPAWQPGAGKQLAALQYTAFMPTSKHTGVAAAISWGHLLGGAAASPLVSRFGARNQVSESLAFVYHI